jgi:cytochrome c-type biogenesis protein CcmH
MGLAVALLGLTTLAMALLLVPLILRGRNAEARDAYNLAVYRDQLAEIERDVERGIIGPREAAAAKSEIGRRILALTPTGPPSGSSPTSLVVAAIAVMLVPFAAWTLYWDLGSPTLADQPLASRSSPATAPTAAKADPHVDMEDAVRKLTAHLQAQPDDLEGWVLLARSQIDANRYQEAVEAYRHAADLSGNKPEIVGDWAEAQVLAAGGTVTPAAQQAFQSALTDPENAPRSHYYLALAKLQGGDTKGALQDWVDLEVEAPADAEWLPLLRRRISETAQTAGIDPTTLKTSSGASRKLPATAAATPPAAPPMPQGEANMPTSTEVTETARATANASPQERQAMITAMVERLAARLAQQPDDADGWTRLGRSYMVLDQPDKAVEAYAHAAKLKPDDTAVKQQYAEAIIEADGGDDLPAQAATLLRQVLASEPQNAEALWYVGLAEAAVGHDQTAHDLWTKLLAQLPANAPARKEVEQRLAALKLSPAK